MPDASVDAVLAGNALDWLDMEEAGLEMARVLAPGGVLAGVWNVFDDRVSWVARLELVSGARRSAHGTPSAAGAPRRRTPICRTSARSPRFGSAEQAEFLHGQRRAADSLIATLATKAGMLVMHERKQQATLDRIRAYLAIRLETARGEFTRPMLTGGTRGGVTPRVPTDERRTIKAMSSASRPRQWTPDEVRREEAAQRARVRRDAARGVTQNLRDAVAHTEFARRFAEAFKPARRA